MRCEQESLFHPVPAAGAWVGRLGSLLLRGSRRMAAIPLHPTLFPVMGLFSTGVVFTESRMGYHRGCAHHSCGGPKGEDYWPHLATLLAIAPIGWLLATGGAVFIVNVVEQLRSY